MNPKGLNKPAATGMPTRLYILANRKFRRILRTVFRDRSKQPITSSKSFCTTDANTHLLTYLINYLLTYSMEQSPSWEANWFSASQEIPHILWNPKIHSSIQRRPPPFPILSQPNSVLTFTSHFLNIHLNIVVPSMPGSPKWSLSLRFPHFPQVSNTHNRYKHINRKKLLSF